jgi:hypothetical protein
MSWHLVCNTEGSLAKGPTPKGDAVMARGTLMIEFDRGRAQTSSCRLVDFSCSQGWARRFTVFSNPDGSVSVENRQGQSRSYVRVSSPSRENDRLRISYSWGGPERVGALTLECLETGSYRQAVFTDPVPLPVRDANTIVTDLKRGRHHPHVTAMALSRAWERVGPAPTITAGSLVDTPEGQRPIESLQLGDRVTTRSHGDQQLRWVLRGRRPNIGFDRQITLAAPWLGLEQDLQLTARQRVELPVDEVQQVLGQDIATLEAGALGQDTYDPTCVEAWCFQLLFDMHDCIRVNGIWVEASFVGRLGQSGDALAGTWFSQLSRMALPVHTQYVAPKIERENPGLLAQLIA